MRFIYKNICSDVTPYGPNGVRLVATEQSKTFAVLEFEDANATYNLTEVASLAC